MSPRRGMTAVARTRAAARRGMRLLASARPWSRPRSFSIQRLASHDHRSFLLRPCPVTARRVAPFEPARLHHPRRTSGGMHPRLRSGRPKPSEPAPGLHLPTTNSLPVEPGLRTSLPSASALRPRRPGRTPCSLSAPVTRLAANSRVVVTPPTRSARHEDGRCVSAFASTPLPPPVFTAGRPRRLGESSRSISSSNTRR